MPDDLQKVEIAIESVDRRTFAIAVDWPGWARSGRDEESAIQNLLSYGVRYAAVLQRTPYPFIPPDSHEAFQVVERLEGNSTTAFGAPAMPIQDDSQAVTGDDLARFKALMHASWQAFDQVLQASEGIELRKGQRGGGRDQEKMVEHLIMADESYLGKLGWKFKGSKDEEREAKLTRIRAAMLEGLEASVRGEIPRQGPRGGARWTPRFFVRREVWHTLDHAWEVEDRTI